MKSARWGNGLTILPWSDETLARNELKRHVQLTFGNGAMPSFTSFFRYQKSSPFNSPEATIIKKEPWL